MNNINTNTILTNLAQTVYGMVGEASEAAFAAWTVDVLPAGEVEFNQLMLAEMVEAGNLADERGQHTLAAAIFSFAWAIQDSKYAHTELTGLIGRACFGYRHTWA